eukprot:scaffold268825_cov14-Tisochrysis_lutea.AAC.1
MGAEKRRQDYARQVWLRALWFPNERACQGLTKTAHAPACQQTAPGSARTWPQSRDSMAPSRR